MQGSCEEAIMVVRDAHWQTLVAVALLEDMIDRLSHSLSCSHWCSGSHWAQAAIGIWAAIRQRSQAGSHQTKVPQVEAY